MKTDLFTAIFFQKWGTFTNETLVCVGVTKNQIRNFMVRHRVKHELIEDFDKVKDKEDSTAFVWTPKGSGCTLLWMNGFEASDEDQGTLVHETNHMVFEIARDKGFSNECEINAYQQEFLYKSIWRELTRRYVKFQAKSLGVKSKREVTHEHESGASQRGFSDVCSLQSGVKGQARETSAETENRSYGGPLCSQASSRRNWRR